LRARIHKLAYKRQRKQQISEYRYKRKHRKGLKKARQKKNTTIERRRPPAWDPPILLLVDGKLVVITTLGVVVAIVGWSSCLRGSIIWSRQTDMGEKKAKQP
jgi:hypothetical protein